MRFDRARLDVAPTVLDAGFVDDRASNAGSAVAHALRGNFLRRTGPHLDAEFGKPLDDLRFRQDQLHFAPRKRSTTSGGAARRRKYAVPRCHDEIGYPRSGDSRYRLAGAFARLAVVVAIARNCRIGNALLPRSVGLDDDIEVAAHQGHHEIGTLTERHDREVDPRCLPNRSAVRVRAATGSRSAKVERAGLGARDGNDVLWVFKGDFRIRDEDIGKIAHA